MIPRNKLKTHTHILPSWECHHCNNGKISFSKNDKIILKETSYSNFLYHQTGQPEWEYRFTAVGQCDNCKDPTIISGTKYSNFDHDENDMSEHYDIEYCNPAPHIIPIYAEIPDQVKKSLEQIFKLYWSNKLACANQMRQMVEIIIDEHNSRNTKALLSVDNKSTLNTKIEKFSSEFGDSSSLIKELLSVIRIVGNSGSHINNNDLNHNDLLDCLEIFQKIFSILYEVKTDRIKETAERLKFKHGKKLSNTSNNA